MTLSYTMYNCTVTSTGFQLLYVTTVFILTQLNQKYLVSKVNPKMANTIQKSFIDH